MKRLLIGVIAALLLLVGVPILIATFSSPAGRPSLAVSFTGFTNTVGQPRLALFSLSNGSPWSVETRSSYSIQTLQTGKWVSIHRDWITNGGRFLEAGSKEWVAVVAPTNQPAWRVSFSVCQDRGPIWGTARGLLNEVNKFGLPVRVPQNAFYAAPSGVVQE